MYTRNSIISQFYSLLGLVRLDYDCVTHCVEACHVLFMVWYSMVWCGVVWCGVVWCGVVWCGVVWCGVVWCGVVRCGVISLI